MWCTRWYLPLLILPFPRASPYFLFIFLCSLSLHTKPCFYCMILLTALFTTSCYWQPLPIDTPLAHPLYDGNASTFAEALKYSYANALAASEARNEKRRAELKASLAEQEGEKEKVKGEKTDMTLEGLTAWLNTILPPLSPSNASHTPINQSDSSSPSTPTPSSSNANVTLPQKLVFPPPPESTLIQPADRCWCRFSLFMSPNPNYKRGFFAPIDLAQWEFDSVEKLRKDEIRQMEADFMKANGLDAGVLTAETRVVMEGKGIGVGAGKAEREPTVFHKVYNQPPPYKFPSFAGPRIFWGLILETISRARKSNPLYNAEEDATTSKPYTLVSPSIPAGPSETSTSKPTKADADSDAQTQTPLPTPTSTLQPGEKLPWFRREYDLRPYGLDIVFDFGWGRDR